jgi:hypothetical protein
MPPRCVRGLDVSSSIIFTPAAAQRSSRRSRSACLTDELTCTPSPTPIPQTGASKQQQQQQQGAAAMASTEVLSPHPMAAAASLDVTALNSLCPGGLDELLAAAPSSPRSRGEEDEAAAAAAAGLDPARAAKVRAATEVVQRSWQYQVTGSAAAAAVLADLKVRRVSHGGPEGMKRAASALIRAHGLEDTTYVYDLANTVRLFRSWRAAMPRVAPFYAVKCNPEPALLRLLAALGAGFDCASKAELEAVIALGVPRDRVIFAHPCKRPADLRFASDVGVQLTTFDTEGELAKVAARYPGVGLVMRVRCDDPDVSLSFGC